MKILTIEIENYRSILKSEKIYIKDFLLLVGPNNSGKSTILKSLDLFFNDLDFNPINDYPSEKTGKRGYKASTKFRVTFLREPGEKLGHKLSPYFVKKKILDKQEDVITIELEYPRDYKNLESRKIKINSKYRGITKKGNKYYQIFESIKERISYNYIPALRVVDSNDNKFISKLFEYIFDNSNIYKKNHKNYLSSISNQLSSVKKFLKKNIDGFPDIKEINFDFAKIKFNNLCLDVNTSVTTKNKIILEQEGTGLQSALVISIIKYILLMQSSKKKSRMILGFEEPEIFLHPSAQRALINTIKDSKSQSLISTHSPVILDELSPREFTNILRCRSKEKKFIQITSNADIKLLTELYENSDITGGEFFFSNRAILVEGTTDRAILKKQLRKRSYFSDAIIQVGGNTGFGKPIKLIKQFDIPIALVIDGDCFTGKNHGTFQKSLTADGMITIDNFNKLKSYVSKKINSKSGSLSIFRKSKEISKFDGIFVFPEEIEPNLVDDSNIDLILGWFLNYGKKKMNISLNIINELESIKNNSNITENVKKLRNLMSGDDLKKRFITEQLFDYLIKNDKVPIIFEDFVNSIK